MKQDKKSEENKNIDVTRSDRQQVRKDASGTGEEQRQEGSKYKGNPPHHHGAHGEGAYTKQSDNAGMHPGDLDEE